MEIENMTCYENLRKPKKDNYFLTKHNRTISQIIDNAKEMILGYLNINRASGNIVSALVMSNYTEEEIIDFKNNMRKPPKGNVSILKNSFIGIEIKMVDL